MTSGPECPYCGGIAELSHHDIHDQVTYWECADCASSFAQEASGALVYVLDFDQELPRGP